jgi:hypothetical protein
MTKDRTSIMGVHMDDMAAVVSSIQEMDGLKCDLGKFFDLVDLGEVKWLLGMGVMRNRDAWTISISQMAYIKNIAMRLSLEDANQ